MRIKPESVVAGSTYWHEVFGRLDVTEVHRDVYPTGRVGFRITTPGFTCCVLDDDELLTEQVEGEAAIALADTFVDDIHMDNVVEVLLSRGVPAYVAMTGGGVATIFAGEHRERRLERDFETSAVAAGPGTYMHRDYGVSVASSIEFYIGADVSDDLAGFYVERGSTTLQIADLIQELVIRLDGVDTAEFLRDREGDVWEHMSDDGWACVTQPSMTFDLFDLERTYGPLYATTDPRVRED